MQINKIIEISGCDCQYIKDYDVLCNRLEELDEYHVLYVVQGCCHIYENGMEIQAKSGSVVTYSIGEPHHYSFFADEKSTAYYINFKGENIQNWLSGIEFGERRVVNIGVSSTIINIFDKIISELRLKKAYSDYYCLGLFLELVSVISRRINNTSCETRYQTDSRLNKVRKLMHNQFNVNRSIADYASICHLSESRFSILFKDEFGMSPNQYIISIKIQKAKELLQDTDLSIAQITEMLGMENQNYFARIFKKHTGISPTTYRRR